ncbi:single-stranded DNA-binding protein [Nocardioides sp.]|uniref:single-stranded DNA-binding protein n=1 Tax=Nocardioides sp. TaxID=35761 RepID=UPI003512F7FF
MTTTAGPAAGEQTEQPWRNEVHLVGRISGEVVVRVMPSGDPVRTWRLVVPRPEADGGRVDTLDCAVWGETGLARRVGGWRPDDVVAVSGVVRRRFYRAGTLTQSRVEIVVSSGRVVRRATRA